MKLESPPTLERNIDPMFDPRQAYMDAIFQPGLFSVTDVTKALSVSRLHAIFMKFQCTLIFHNVNPINTIVILKR